MFTWTKVLASRIRGWFSVRHVDQDFDQELADHLDLLTNENIRRGMLPEVAQRAARIRLGGLTQLKETNRELRGLPLLETFFQDCRYTFRMLRKSPGFTAVAVLTLALGIGANTAIFSLIDTVMLRMLPVQKPEELAMVAMRHPHAPNESDSGFSYPVYQQIRDRQDVFSGIAASSLSRFDLAQGGASQYIKGLFVSGNFFNTLGISPAVGRLLSPSDDSRGCSGEAVLSYAFWQEHYGGQQSAIGGTISLDRHPFQIIGVSPPSFFGVTVGNHFDVAVPICAEAIVTLTGEPDGQAFLDRPSAQWLGVMGRMKPGVLLERVNAGLQTISPGIFAATLSKDWKPDWQKDFLASTLFATPAGAGSSDLREYGQPLKILMVVVGLVLLVACANIASLMLARASARRKEIAIRMALGASRPRLIRQLLTECIILSSLGALLGILFAWWGCTLMVRFISTSQYHVFLQLSPDGRILGFTAAITVLTGLLFGLLPALRSTRVSLTAAMKGGQSNESHSRSHFRPGRWIVASQIAMSLVLLVVAGLFLRSFNNLMKLDLGFDRTNVLVIETSDQNLKVPREQRSMLYRQILDRLNSLPGAISAGESFITPISGEEWGLDFYLENGQGPKGDDANAAMNFVSPGFFTTLHSPLIAGRDFNEHDTAGSPHVVVINQTMARKFFPNVQPIGQYLLTDDFMNNHRERMAPPMQVIGIVKDSKYRSLRENTASILYIPIAQAELLDDPRIFEIRTAAQPSSLAKSAEEAITGLNKNLSLNFFTLESQVEDSLQPDRLLTILSGFFGGLAMLLALIGLYGTLAYMVAQRRKELGIRMALGAGKSSILNLIMRDVSILLLAGLAAGVVVSFWATRLTQKMLFNLDTHDPKTILFAIGVLAAAALFSGYLPARRATRIDPMLALRDD
jgi:putative ABC transport system permease protein